MTHARKASCVIALVIGFFDSGVHGADSKKESVQHVRSITIQYFRKERPEAAFTRAVGGNQELGKSLFKALTRLKAAGLNLQGAYDLLDRFHDGIPFNDGAALVAKLSQVADLEVSLADLRHPTPELQAKLKALTPPPLARELTDPSYAREIQNKKKNESVSRIKAISLEFFQTKMMEADVLYNVGKNQTLGTSLFNALHKLKSVGLNAQDIGNFFEKHSINIPPDDGPAMVAKLVRFAGLEKIDHFTRAESNYHKKRELLGYRFLKPDILTVAPLIPGMAEWQAETNAGIDSGNGDFLGYAERLSIFYDYVVAILPGNCLPGQQNEAAASIERAMQVGITKGVFRRPEAIAFLVRCMATNFDSVDESQALAVVRGYERAMVRLPKLIPNVGIKPEDFDKAAQAVLGCRGTPVIIAYKSIAPQNKEADLPLSTSDLLQHQTTSGRDYPSHVDQADPRLAAERNRLRVSELLKMRIEPEVTIWSPAEDVISDLINASADTIPLNH